MMPEKFQWIPIKEKKPSESGVYKCTLNDGNVHNILGILYVNEWFLGV